MVLMDSDDVPSLVIDLLPPWLGVSFVLFFSARLSVLLRLPELDLESGFRFLPKLRPVKGKILVRALELIFDIHLTKRHFSRFVPQKVLYLGWYCQPSNVQFTHGWVGGG